MRKSALLVKKGWRIMVVLAMLSGLWLSAPQLASADTKLDELTTGNGPFRTAVNPITNQIYIANEQDSSITIVDGATNKTRVVNTLSHPTAIAVNAVTNRIYVTHPDDDKVSVIDGAGNVIAVIDAGDGPIDIVVNAATNKIYVANMAGDDVTVIDGTSHTTETVVAGDEPYRISVNAVTDKIYVVNKASDNVTVIDGADNSTQTITVESLPNAVAVNPITNKIYVTNQGDDSVTVIDGADNSTEPPVAVGDSPAHIAVNPVTNKIYVANQGDNSVTVIDGTDSSTGPSVAVGASPQFITVNSVTNKIYVVNLLGAENITIIDGASNTTKEIATGDGPYGIVVNPVTNKIYVTNQNDDTVTVIEGADNKTETVAVGDAPYAVAVNTVTNKIYVPNYYSSTVTVIDGADNTIETVATGGSYDLAVNEVTNKIYVANMGENTVTVIDGVDLSTEIVDVGNSPYHIAVNPITNKIYVANSNSDSVSVIDGLTNEVETVVAGDSPYGIAIDSIRNKIYVSNTDSNDVTIINGADNTTETVAVGTTPFEIEVNSVTNKIYVANQMSSTVTVIDGVDHTTQSVATGSGPSFLEINSKTNKVYVSAEFGDTVTVIDGADNSTVTLAMGSRHRDISINPATNKIYLNSSMSIGSVTVIDGNSNAMETIAVGKMPGRIAVNTATNRIYVVNQASDSVSVIDGAGRTSSSPLQVEFVPLPGHVASGINNAFTFRITNAYHPNPAKVLGVYYQLDDTLGEWKRADVSGEDWVATVSSATYGRHVLYALALEAQGDGVTAGIASAYTFNRVPDNMISPEVDRTAPVIDLTASPTSPTYGKVTVTAAVYETGSGMASLKWSGGARSAAYFASGGTSFVGSFEVSANGTYTVYARDVAGNEAVETIEVTNLRIPTTPSGPGLVDQAKPDTDPEPKTEIFIDKGIIIIRVAPKDIKEVKQGDGRTLDQVVLPHEVVDKLSKLLETVERPLVRILVNDRKPDVNLQLPADLLGKAMAVRSDATFEARLNGSSFQLEVKVLDLKQLAAKLGVDVKDMKVNIRIKTLTGAEREELVTTARKQGMTLLSEAVEFRLFVTGGDQMLEIHDFGGTYMMKSIVLDAGMAKRNYTAVLYDPDAQSFTFVPAVTSNDSDRGAESVMRMPHNSIYAVMESAPASFADMQGHWAKSPVEQMASKRMVSGVSKTAYAPDRAITRAEFTALLVRALGIRTETAATGNVFKDVVANAWYASAVEAGARSGLVNGLGESRFAPDERITREQMAVMLANARVLATGQTAGTRQTANLPSGFSDAAEVSLWARAAIAEAVADGLIQGITPDRLAPAESATRAQAAVMLKRLMEDIGFLDN